MTQEPGISKNLFNPEITVPWLYKNQSLVFKYYCNFSYMLQKYFNDIIINIVMIFAHNNPHLWVQTTFMSLWFYIVASNHLCY